MDEIHVNFQTLNVELYLERNFTIPTHLSCCTGFFLGGLGLFVEKCLWYVGFRLCFFFYMNLLTCAMGFGLCSYKHWILHCILLNHKQSHMSKDEIQSLKILSSSQNQDSYIRKANYLDRWNRRRLKTAWWYSRIKKIKECICKCKPMQQIPW